MSVPQARELVSDATVSLVRIVASAVLKDRSPAPGADSRGAGERDFGYDVELWTTLV